MSAIRRDVATLGAGWNKTLLNYALAMRALDDRAITERTSWKFLAAMHGVDAAGWVDFGVLESDGLPDDLTNGTFGDQCQHGSWYFLPWHRAYLAAFEAIVAAKVKELTGDDWALPYWNYLDKTSPKAKHIPDAFIADKLPDGSDNPLNKYPRDPGFAALPPALPQDFSLIAMAENDFLIGTDGSIGFGGGVTDNFMHFWNRKGDVERNPHDTVHGMIGGFMGDVNYAGLDPIFWLHHCNIDRLWEAWMRTAGKKMVSDPRWREGPGDRSFIMPQPDGSGANFTARDTLKGGKYYPAYDDLTKGTGVQPGVAAVAGLGMGPADQQKVELIGANAAVVTVGGQSASTRVDLKPAAAADGVAMMGVTDAGQKVSRLYLKLEGIRGAAPSPLVEVYVNVPDGADPHDHPDLRAAGLTLFGLNVASKPDGAHGGNGLGYALDITDIAQKLAASGGFDPDHLRVTLVPGKGVSENKPVTVDRIAVLKRTGTVD